MDTAGSSSCAAGSLEQRGSSLTYWISSRNVGAIYPGLFSELPQCGSVFIGREQNSHPFLYNPFELYAAGVLTSPNILVFGHIGHGKSALIKAMLKRHIGIGLHGCVLDPKGEYQPLSKSLGGSTFSFGKGPETGLNPLARLSNPEMGDPGSFLGQMLDGLALTFSAIRRRELTPMESYVLEECLEHLWRDHRETDLYDVYEVLIQMRERAWSSGGAFEGESSQTAGQMALELRRYLFGDLRGVIDGRKGRPVPLDSTAKLIHVDLFSALRPEAMRVGVPLFLALLSKKLSMGSQRHLIVLDEAWMALASPGCVEFFRSYWKLARGYGISNIAVVHRSEDLSASGDLGSITERVANGLVSDSQTFIIFNLDSTAAQHLGGLLGLSSTEVALISTLPRGRCLWKIPGRTYLVDVLLTSQEKMLFDTDERMARPDV